MTKTKTKTKTKTMTGKIRYKISPLIFRTLNLQFQNFMTPKIF